MRIKILADTKVYGEHVGAGEVRDDMHDAEAAELVAAGRAEVLAEPEAPEPELKAEDADKSDDKKAKK